jgi:tetratricopeptide (TPR) repeat protein
LEKYATNVTSPYSKAVTLTSVGISYRRNGQPDKAVGAYERAMKADPDYPGSYNSLAYLHALDQKRTDFSAALNLIDRALKLRPNDPNYLDTKGWILFRAGRFDEATVLLETAVAAQPENVDFREHLDQARKASTRAAQLGKR